MAWSIRNYNAFVRSAKERYSLNSRQAQGLYRSMSKRLSRPLTGTDLKKHPRIAKQEASKVKEGKRGPSFGVTSPVGPGGRGGGRIVSFDDWDLAYDEATDFDVMDIEGGVDTGKKGR